MRKFISIFFLLVLVLSSSSVIAASDSETLKNYNGILEDYRSFITESKTGTVDRYKYSHIKFRAIDQLDLSQIGYTLMDLDNNGVKELLVGPVPPNPLNGDSTSNYGVIYGLYTLNGTEPVFVSGTYHYEGILWLTKDNLLGNLDYPLGDMYFALRTDKLSFVEGYRFDWDGKGNRYYSDLSQYDNDTPKIISSDERSKIQQKHESKHINYISLKDYFSKNNEEDNKNTDTSDSDISSPTSNSDQIYRLYNPQSGEHLYTSDSNEAKVLSSQGSWNNEGIGWTAPKSGMPVYRLYSPVTGSHLFTTDSNEVKVLSKSGWSIDNGGKPLFYSGGSKSVYRLYSPALRMHLITTDVNEYNVLGTQGWNKEGVKLKAQ